MRLKKVYKHMRAWNDLRPNSDKMNELLSAGNSFSFHSLSALSSKEFLHVYPAIRRNKLCFYLISSRFDSPEYTKKEIREHLVRVKFKFQKFPETNVDSIPEKEAKQLVENWVDNAYAWWITEQCKESGKLSGLFYAFAIPGSDVPCKGEMIAFLALSKEVPSGHDPYKADLVIWARDEQFEPYSYSDTVRPVPPFGGGIAGQESAFYLLKAAGILS